MANINNNMYDQPTDDMSLLLRQILFKSQPPPPPPSSSSTPKPQHPPRSSVPTAASNAPVNVVGHVASSSAGTTDYDPDEYDSDCQEALGHLMEEMVAKPDHPRNSSKRTRAAEVHNMSEKRRRSRINEKMKALQKLIPNSNKTDKASMLDEAIEYLKQLQLQVQMLTMRNGINLYSMCSPLQPNHRPYAMTHGNQSIHMTANHGTLFVNQMLSQNQPSVLHFSPTIHQEPPFGTQLGSS